jgi:hypothetical protein
MSFSMNELPEFLFLDLSIPTVIDVQTWNHNCITAVYHCSICRALYVPVVHNLAFPEAVSSMMLLGDRVRGCHLCHAQLCGAAFAGVMGWLPDGDPDDDE